MFAKPLIVFSILSQIGLAQDAFTSLDGEAGVLETVVIKGTLIEPTSPFRPFLPSETIDEETLKRIAQGTLGETIGWQPGVTSSSYGQGASRPIIRGFDGFRVRMLRDSIGTLDVSASSPDHGLPLEPLLLREVEILRGPASLLYGNSALGGAVNSISRTFTTEMPDRQFSGALETRWDSVSSAWTQAGYLDLALGDFVLSLTASHRDAQDYKIPGRARTSEYQSLFQPIVNNPASGTTIPIPNPSGTLPNSFHQSDSHSIGLSWLPDDVPLEASVAFSNFHSDFGLPYLFGGDANDLFGFSSLEMTQDRFDLRLRYLADLPWLSDATFHFGIADYHHTERFSGRGKDADLRFDDTRFNLNAREARLDLTHEPTDWLRGVAGLQIWSNDLEPSRLAGAPDESSRFFNRFETSNLGFFINETATFGEFELNAALRWETQTIKDRSLARFGFTRELDDTSVSAILGASWEREQLHPFDRFKTSLTASFIERIPTETERFAFWDNPAIQRFLIGGDLDGQPLRTEQAFGLDLGFEADLGPVEMKLNLFHNQIDDFIYLQDIRGIGNQATYTQTDAHFTGLEAQLDWFIYETDDRELTFTVMSDWIRASDRDNNSPLPRIPPLRMGTRLQYQHGPLQTGLEIRHAFSQDRFQAADTISQGELPTDAYTEVNLDFSYELEFRNQSTLTLFAQVRNLLDEERRLHTSFLKDVAPLPGRNFTLGGRIEF